MRPLIEPEPPRVECEQPRSDEVPEVPVAWWLDGPVWAAELLGLLEEERSLRRVEHSCLSRLRDEGLIR